MAYDQHAAYEPPRRGYQLAQKNSLQNMYAQASSPWDEQETYAPQQRNGGGGGGRGGYQDDGGYDRAGGAGGRGGYQDDAGYDRGGGAGGRGGYQDDAGYDQGGRRQQPTYQQHQQQQQQRQQPPRQQPPPQSQSYDQRNDRGYGGYHEEVYSPQQSPPENNYHAESDNRQYHGNGSSQGYSDRSYDPRYQPRAPPSQGQPRNVANGGPPPPMRLHNGTPAQGDPRSAPRQNTYPAPQQRPPQQRPNDDYASQQYAQPTSPHGYDSRAPPPRQAGPPQQQQRQADPSRGSMAEWKAREKAKMQGMRPPETIAQDTAFPTIGNKPGRTPERGSGRPGGNSAMNRQSHETADGGMSRPREGYGSERTDSKDLQYARPHLESKLQEAAASTAVDQGSNWPIREEQRPSSRQHPTSGEHQQPPRVTSPLNDQYPDQWPMTNQMPPSTSSPSRHVDDRRSPPQPMSPNYGPQSGRGPPPAQYDQQQQPGPRTMPGRGPPTLQPLDTAALPPPNPSYSNNDSHAPSPQSAAPARNFSSGTTQLFSPTSQYSQPSMMASPTSYGGPKPWTQQPTRSGSAGDIYAAGSRGGAPPRTREEQIEEEMPNFEAPAALVPGGIARTRAGPPPPVDRYGLDGAASAPPAMSAQAPRPYQQRPGYDDLGERPATVGPGASRPNIGAQQQQDPYYNGDNRGYADGGGYDEQQDMHPPRAPFANSQPVRRSTDDGQRQMPYRPGPGAGRGNGPPPPRNGYPGNGGPYGNDLQSPPQRPDLQTTYSDPGMQHRAGSVPPGRQMQEMGMGMGMGAAGGMGPGMGPGPNGAPLSQQRSAPDQMQVRHSNPDALPHHAVPVRPGLGQQQMPPQQMDGQRAKPPPVRNYNIQSGTPAPIGNSQQQHQRQPSADPFAEPVTKAELTRLLADLEANPYSNKRALIYAKKLVEAASVLANEGGRADAKTTNKNRERYYTDAFKRVKKLAANGYPEAQFYLADCYGQGTLGLEPDTKEAFNLYQAAAKAGHPQAAYRTAVCCEMGPEEGGGTRRDYPKAVQWYRRAATLGDSAAMFKIGVVLLKGLLGEQKNISEAINWLKRAAERADKDTPHALHELSGLYETSNTSPEVRNKIVADDAYALELLQRAAGLGYKFSQFRLGQAYEYGHLGLQIDNRSSIMWYTKAAAQAEHQAELALSGWYLTGADGILEHNDTEAYLWARKAAVSEPPLAKAMFAMGYFTENGIGCPASLEEAKKWYGRAAYYKFPKALERLEEMRKNPGKGRSAPGGGKLSRKDQKRDEAECTVM